MSHPNDVVWYLRIEQNESEGVSLLTVTGRVSSLTAPEFQARLSACIGAPARGVVLDLSGVDYISSPGLRALQDASAALTGSGRLLILCGVRDSVRMAFALAGLERVLVIESSRDRAVGKIVTVLGP